MTPEQSYTAAQVREAEEPHLASGEPLMQRAAMALATEVTTLLQAHRGGVTGAQVLVLAGAGNNGGDALFAAAQLAGLGARVSILPTSERLHREGLEAAIAAGASLRRLDEPAETIAHLGRASDIILDGILGTGSTTDPALRGRARVVVAALLGAADEAAPALVVAVDLPSGIQPDDGTVPDPTVLPADVTVTFGGCKSGLLRAPATDYVGRVVVIDIGISADLERIRLRDLHWADLH